MTAVCSVAVELNPKRLDTLKKTHFRTECETFISLVYSSDPFVFSDVALPFQLPGHRRSVCLTKTLVLELEGT